jgi:hypothetical protein
MIICYPTGFCINSITQFMGIRLIYRDTFEKILHNRGIQSLKFPDAHQFGVKPTTPGRFFAYYQMRSVTITAYFPDSYHPCEFWKIDITKSIFNSTKRKVYILKC